MGGLKAENLDWLARLETLQAQPANATRAELKTVLKSGDSHITDLQILKPCFDQTAIDKVRQTSQNYILSFNSAKALAGLNGRVSDLHGATNAALDVVLGKKLAPKRITALVEWVASGKLAAEFDPKAKPSKTAVNHKVIQQDLAEKEPRSPKNSSGISSHPPATEAVGGRPKTQQTPTSHLDLNQLGQLLEKAKAERVQGSGTKAQEKLEAYLQKIAASHSSSPAGISAPKGPQENLSETLLLDWLADIPVLARIKAKRKKGKSLSGGEWGLLLAHKGGELLGHGFKLFFKTFKPLLKIIHGAWKLVVEALKELGLYKYVKALFTIVVFVAACWFAWEAFHYGLIRPVEIIWSKIHFKSVATDQSAPIPTPAPAAPALSPAETPEVSKLLSFANTAMVHLKPKPTAVPTPLIVYQPAISFKTTDFDPKLLEIEMASIPSSCLVKDFPVTPDETMPGDLATSRLQDLTNTDKYTMKIGQGTEKILSVIPSATTLTLGYKSADALGGFLDGSGQMNFFWEDVKVIHVNELDVFPSAKASRSSLSGTQQAQIIFQCSLVVNGSKNPLTIQCASADDLEHLVSTMEYFIRNSRLAHDTALGGMPYSFQGLRLANGVVDKLWANSPMDKAGVSLGDYLWSIGKIASEPQDNDTLERGLSPALSGGAPLTALTFYTVSPAEWLKGRQAMRSSNVFKPKLRKVYLQL